MIIYSLSPLSHMDTEFMLSIMHSSMKILFLWKHFHEILLQLRILTEFNNAYWNNSKSMS